jgi:hypothetical protein
MTDSLDPRRKDGKRQRAVDENIIFWPDADVNRKRAKNQKSGDEGGY